MKKIYFAVFFTCFSAILCAAAPTHKTINDDMRIFIKDGQEAITRFPSAYLKEDFKINIIFPKDYDTTKERYPAVYLISDKNLEKAYIDTAFYGRKSQNPKAVFITIDIDADFNTQALAKFITLELFPYFETNYRILNTPEDRVLAASGEKALEIFEILSLKSGYFKNVALILTDTTAMPAVEGAPSDISVWAAGSLSNMARLQTLLEKSGLSYLNNFAYRIINTKTDKPVWNEINLLYLLNKGSRGFVEAKSYLGVQKLSEADAKPVTLWLNIKTKGKYLVDYIPQTVKMSPPFFMWDPSSAQLNLIPGAEAGNVKLSGQLPFGGDFETSVKIVK